MEKSREPMVFVVRPILFAFLRSNAVKKLIVDLLKAYVKTTDNTVDDQVVVFVEKNLFPENRIER